jgi:hypothetical protein
VTAAGRSAVAGWGHAATIATALAALAALGWEGWPDLLMDFGRELYVAWRLAEGDALYRDVASFYGPLSPYANALWFRLFGAGVRTLVLANLALLALTTAVLWALARRGSGGGRLAATVAALAFLSMCGLAQRVSSGSFNFAAPYSHEATHGFLLAAASVWAAVRLVQSAAWPWAGVAGALAGVSFLTKPESFVAALGTSAACVALALARPGRRPPWAHTLAAYAAGLLLPPALAFALLAAAMPAADAARGVAGSWAYSGNADLAALPYFAWSMGTDDVFGNLGTIARATVVQAVLFGAALLAAVGSRHGSRRAAVLAAASAIGVASLLLAVRDTQGWVHVARPLPVWTLAAVAWSAWSLWRVRAHEGLFALHAARFGLALFALLFLPRMLLHGRLYHYGFVLAAPAVVLVAAMTVDWIPRALQNRGRAGIVFRAAALAALAVTAGLSVQLTHGWMQAKRWTVGAGADRIRADVRGAFVNATLQAVPALLPAGGRVAVLPEGVTINYLLRTRSSIPFVTVLPSDVATFGEGAFLDAFQRDPPEVILIVHRDTREFGAPFFGADYARALAEWIGARYVPAGRAGDAPLRDGSRFGIAALRRRDAPPAATRP